MLANSIVLIVYLVSVLGSALYVARRRRNAVSGSSSATSDYFLASRGLSGVALGLSLVATTMSSVTFLAYPATSFKTNWMLFNKDFSLPLLCVFAAVYVIPFFRAHVKLSVFEILENSFPLSRLTGLSVQAVTVVSGVLIAVYTVTGGFAAVVFTDVIQAVTLVAGGIISLLFCVREVPGGLAQIVKDAAFAGKMRLDVDFTDAGRSPPLLWLFGASTYLLTLCVYQDTVQRYCAARSLKQARLAVLMKGCLVLPIWAFFYLLGSSLYVFSLQDSGAFLRASDPDSIVSDFALEFLPPGAGGIVLAGVLAAAMSSLDSSMNSVAGVITVDFVERLWYSGSGSLSERRLLRTGKCASVILCCLTVAGALLLHMVKKEGMNDLYNGLMSISGGASGGLMLLAVFTTAGNDDMHQTGVRWRTRYLNGRVAIFGIIATSLVTVAPVLCSFRVLDGCSLSFYWVLPISNAVFFLAVLVGVLFQYLLNRYYHPSRWNLEPKSDEGAELIEHGTTRAAVVA